MMKNLAQIYDQSFFNEWGKNNSKYVDSAKVVTDVLVQQLNPRRVIDIGCGCGVYGHHFKNKGVDVVSLDGVQAPGDDAFDIKIETIDITEPFNNVWGPFDFTLCLEVAEHIHESDSDIFLKNIIQMSDTLVLSAAPPNQGGHHHVNERPKRYWVKKLADLGFIYNRKRTGRFVEAFRSLNSPFKWMGEHISIYEKLSNAEDLKRDLPFQVKAGG